MTAHLDNAMVEVGLCASQHGCIPSAVSFRSAMLGQDGHGQAPKTDCDSIADKKDCDAAKCSWCVAGAVPPSCKTIDEAKQLPAGVFNCDNI